MSSKIDECMDLLDQEFLTEIEMEELALTKQEDVYKRQGISHLQHSAEQR